jgi:hypothetical protein|tara:strand:- start:4384 stop:4983 length:600 start_codon:yes stop_codon:yes gene_type:complete
MSGSFPTSPISNGINITSNQTTIVSTAINGRRQARQLQNQRWSMTVSFPPMTRTNFAPIFAFINSQRGRKESFTYTPPIIDDALGTETGSVLVNGVHAVGDTTIAMDAFAGDGAGRFKAGDFLKFASHDKVYMVVSDVTSSSNAATVTIEPPLTTALADNSAVTYDSVPFTVALKNDVQEFQIGQDALFRYELDFIEVL